MPRTLDFAALVLSITQRATIMRANIVDAKKVIANAADNHQPIVCFDK
jgi:hypothetical protein